MPAACAGPIAAASSCGSRTRPIVSVTPTSSGADEGALDRADAADDDDDEGEDEHRLAHADLHRLQGADHGAGEAGQRGAQRKHHRVEAADVDAQRADHLAVGFAGADAHAEPRPGDQHVEGERPRRGRRR